MTAQLQAELDQQERTAAWLARKTGFDPSLITRILNGERRPSDDFKRKAAEALGVLEDELFPAGEAVA